MLTATYGDAPPPPPPPDPSDANAVDALDWGTQLADNTINVFFAGAGVHDFDGQRIVTASFNSYEKSQFREAFDQIETVTDEYAVARQIVGDPASDNYTVNHSSVIYVIGRDGQVIDLLNADAGPDELAAQFRRYL